MSPLALLVIKYKYALLVPIGLIEGHIISLLAGFLAHLGYLNIFLAGLCIAFGNLIGDMLLYWLGYHKGESFVKRYGHYLGLTDELLAKGSELFHKQGSYILIISKLSNGFGFAIAVLFSAGMLKIPFKKFMFWNILGEILWTGSLITIGYFFGHAYATIGSSISKVFFVLGSIVVLIFIFFRMKQYLINKFTT